MQTIPFLYRWAGLLLLAVAAGGCSMGQMAVRGSMPLLEGGMEAMNHETDLELAREAIPATLKMLEGMLAQDPGNAKLRLLAAQGFYGYGFAFVEAGAPGRAAALYRRCFDHARQALPGGLGSQVETLPLRQLEAALGRLGKDEVPALFWSASCWSKWIDMNRDDPRSIAGLARAAAMMERALALDPGYYYGGPELFFGVYYGSRPPMLGGDLERAERHFARAREYSGGRLLLVDVFYAEYLARQRLDREAFHARLTRVIETPVGNFPEMAFANQVARERARRLLAKEDQWF